MISARRGVETEMDMLQLEEGSSRACRLLQQSKRKKVNTNSPKRPITLQLWPSVRIYVSTVSASDNGCPNQGTVRVPE